jgi:integrase
MSIYRRGKTWWYSIAIKGKTHRGSCKTQDQRQAQEFHDTIRADIWRGRVLGDKTRRTLKEAVTRFLEEHEHKRTWRADQRFGKWWLDKLQVKYLDEVTADMVKAVRDTEARSVKPATVNRKIAFLRAVVNAAWKEWQWIDSAPKFKLLPGEVERRRFLEPHEALRLVEALPEPYSAAALFAVSTGLRQANIFGLRWDQVNLGRRVAMFPEQVMKNGLPFSCPLNETAVQVLRSQFGKHETFVFCRKDGGRINGLPSKLWRAALEKAGLKDVRWHDLRHTWASLMRQSGVGLDDLQELGGWESRVMVQRYAHLNVEHLAPAAAMLDRALGAPSEGRRAQA